MNEERAALMWAYLKALKRLEESVSSIAFELGLPRLRNATLNDLELIDQKIFDFAESADDDE